MEKFTPPAKFLHCRRQWRHGQIPPLQKYHVIAKRCKQKYHVIWNSCKQKYHVIAKRCNQIPEVSCHPPLLLAELLWNQDKIKSTLDAPYLFSFHSYLFKIWKYPPPALLFPILHASQNHHDLSSLTVIANCSGPPWRGRLLWGPKAPV